jgi:hypothetical protein
MAKGVIGSIGGLIRQVENISTNAVIKPPDAPVSPPAVLIQLKWK